MAAPETPSAKEREGHELTHVPFATVVQYLCSSQKKWMRDISADLRENVLRIREWIICR